MYRKVFWRAVFSSILSFCEHHCFSLFFLYMTRNSNRLQYFCRSSAVNLGFMIACCALGVISEGRLLKGRAATGLKPFVLLCTDEQRGDIFGAFSSISTILLCPLRLDLMRSWFTLTDLCWEEHSGAHLQSHCTRDSLDFKPRLLTFKRLILYFVIITSSRLFLSVTVTSMNIRPHLETGKEQQSVCVTHMRLSEGPRVEQFYLRCQSPPDGALCWTWLLSPSCCDLSESARWAEWHICRWCHFLFHASQLTNLFILLES